jgi:hypothetical protein
MRSLVCCVLAVCLAACRGSSGTTTPLPPPSVLGSWDLVTVNGDSLPFTLSHAGGADQLWVDEVITLMSDGTFLLEGDLQENAGSQVSKSNYVEAGTYTVSGGNITTVYGGGTSTGTGSYSGNTMHLSAQGYALVYVHR